MVNKCKIFPLTQTLELGTDLTDLPIHIKPMDFFVCESPSFQVYTLLVHKLSERKVNLYVRVSWQSTALRAIEIKL